MNWGIRIIIILSVFCLSIGAVVIFLMNQKVDLVETNYYEKELKYQEQINRLARTNALKDTIKVIYTGSEIKINYPNVPDKSTGKDFISLYRPSDNLKDIKIPVIADTSRTQIITTDRIDRGYWKVKLNWTSAGTEYYYETAVNVK